MASDEAADGRLLGLYRRYVGEPDRETDVYVGFALFFGGIALGAIGLFVFLWSATLPGDQPFFWQLREIAIALAFVGLPAFVLSVVVLLPVGARTTYAGVAGAALCLVAVAVFVAVYPRHWNVQGTADYSAQGIAVYAGGLAVLVGSTGAALVAHHLERSLPAAEAGEGGVAAAAATSASGGADGNGGAAGSGTVTDEQIRRDIEEATESVELTWGGVEKSDTKRLKIRTGDADDDVDYGGFDPAAAKQARSSGVDDAVTGLRKLQGGEAEAGTGEGVDDQTAALRELRDRQRAEEAERPDTVFDRVRDRLGLE